jgi:hypothetical protein
MENTVKVLPEIKNRTTTFNPINQEYEEGRMLVQGQLGLLSMFCFFAVLGLELRAYTLSHSTSPFLF